MNDLVSDIISVISSINLIISETKKYLILAQKIKTIGGSVIPGVISRKKWSTWGGNTSKLNKNKNINCIVIHHSGNSGEKDPLKIEGKHKANGWDDIGYHFLITPSGKIYEGRNLAFEGAHVLGGNKGTIGIILMGDFQHQWWDFDDEPTNQQLDALKYLIPYLILTFPLITKLGGHTDYATLNPTVCPGDELYKKLPEIRKKFGLVK